MLDMANNDAARAEASAMIKKLREQGVLPDNGLPSASPPALSPTIEDTVPCVVEGHVLRARNFDNEQDENESGSSASFDEIDDDTTSVAESYAPEDLLLPDSPSSRGKQARDMQRIQFSWTPIDADTYDAMSESEVQSALIAHKMGAETTGAPLVEGLKHIKGVVIALIKVEIASGTKKGSRISFQWEGKSVCSVYKGLTQTEGHSAVFACHEKPQRSSLSRKIVAGLSKVGSWKRTGSASSAASTTEESELQEAPEIFVETAELLSSYTPRDSKRIEFVWCDVPCAELENIPRMKLDDALDNHSKGSDEGEQPLLTEALKCLQGRVLGLIKLRLPPSTPHGAQVSFRFDVANTKAFYAGPSTDDAVDAVFAVHDPTLKLARKLSLNFGFSSSSNPSSPKNAQDTPSQGSKRRAQLEFVWSSINCDELSKLTDKDVVDALDALNSGDMDAVPQCLASGLSQHGGSIVGLIKVQVRENTRKGQRLAFDYKGKKVIGVYNGGPRPTHLAVFVARKKSSVLAGLSTRLRSGMTKFDSLRGSKDGQRSAGSSVPSSPSNHSTRSADSDALL